MQLRQREAERMLIGVGQIGTFGAPRQRALAKESLRRRRQARCPRSPSPPATARPKRVADRGGQQRRGQRRHDTQALRRRHRRLLGRRHRQRLFHGVANELVHRPAFAETHLDLGRMHVDVDQPRLDRQPQRVGRLAVAMQHVSIRLAQRVGQHAVAHEAAVDEEVLRVARERARRRVRRAHRPAGKCDSRPGDIDYRSVGAETLAQQRIDACAAPAARAAENARCRCD